MKKLLEIIQEKLTINSKTKINKNNNHLIHNFDSLKEGDIIYVYNNGCIEFYKVDKIVVKNDMNNIFELKELQVHKSSKNYIEPNKESPKRYSNYKAVVNKDKLIIRINAFYTFSSYAYLYEDEPIKYKE